MINRSGPVKYVKKTLREVLSDGFRDAAIEKLNWWADLLEIDKELIYELPFPSNANGSVDGVNIAVKKKFGNLLKQPKVMAKILGKKDE